MDYKELKEKYTNLKMLLRAIPVDKRHTVAFDYFTTMLMYLKIEITRMDKDIESFNNPLPNQIIDNEG